MVFSSVASGLRFLSDSENSLHILVLNTWHPQLFVLTVSPFASGTISRLIQHTNLAVCMSQAVSTLAMCCIIPDIQDGTYRPFLLALRQLFVGTSFSNLSILWTLGAGAVSGNSARHITPRNISLPIYLSIYIVDNGYWRSGKTPRT